MTSLKISLDDEMRRTTLHPSEEGEYSFQELDNAVRYLYRHKLSKLLYNSFVIRYQDEASDWITISSDSELCEAMSVLKAMGKVVLRLNISLYERSISSFVSPSTGRYGNQPSGQVPPSGTNIYPPLLSSYNDMWSHQNGPLVKPTAESLQKQRTGLKKCESRNKSTLEPMFTFYETWSRASKLLASKSPTSVKEAIALYKSLLIMDSTNEVGICFDIARGEAILGNKSEAMVYLTKAVSRGFIKLSSIESNPDFESLRPMESFQSLLSRLRHPVGTGFNQYILSTLRCAGSSGDLEKYKWPLHEAEKAQRKFQ